MINWLDIRLNIEIISYIVAWFDLDITNTFVLLSNVKAAGTASTSPSVLFIRGLAERNQAYWRQREQGKVKLHTNCFFKAPICVKLPVWVHEITLTTAFWLLVQDFSDVGFLKLSQRYT